jgi:hypothetical protein
VLRIGSLVVGVRDTAVSRGFWERALDYVARDDPSEDDAQFLVLVPRSGTGAQLALMRSESPLEDHPRVHLDLYADDAGAEIARLTGLGATLVDWDSYPPDPDFTVLADPDGNAFCVIDKSGS